MQRSYFPLLFMTWAMVSLHARCFTDTINSLWLKSYSLKKVQHTTCTSQIFFISVPNLSTFHTHLVASSLHLLDSFTPENNHSTEVTEWIIYTKRIKPSASEVCARLQVFVHLSLNLCHMLHLTKEPQQGE